MSSNQQLQDDSSSGSARRPLHIIGKETDMDDDEGGILAKSPRVVDVEYDVKGTAHGDEKQHHGASVHQDSNSSEHIEWSQSLETPTILRQMPMLSFEDLAQNGSGMQVLTASSLASMVPSPPRQDTSPAPMRTPSLSKAAAATPDTFTHLDKKRGSSSGVPGDRDRELSSARHRTKRRREIAFISHDATPDGRSVEVDALSDVGDFGDRFDPLFKIDDACFETPSKAPPQRLAYNNGFHRAPSSRSSTATTIASGSSSASTDALGSLFKTASGGSVPPPSERALQKARKQVEAASAAVPDPSTMPPAAVGMPLFATAKGSALPPPSAAALQKAQAAISAEMHSAPANSALVLEQPTGPSAVASLFTTGKGAALSPPSAAALQRAQSTVLAATTNRPAASLQPDAVSKTASTNTSAFAFTSAAGSSMPAPSSDALRKAQALLSDAGLVGERDIASTPSKLPTPAANTVTPSVSKPALATPFVTPVRQRGSLTGRTPASTADSRMLTGAQSLQSRLRRTPNTSNGRKYATAFRTPFKTPAMAQTVAERMKADTNMHATPSSAPLRNGTRRSSFEMFNTSARAERQTLSQVLQHHSLGETDTPGDDVDACSAVSVKFAEANSVSGTWGAREAHAELVARGARDPQCISMRWTANHYRWIVWKIACYVRRRPDLLQTWWSKEKVLHQLLYRYEREVNQAQRSCLKLIVERDDSPAKYMVLVVSGLQGPGSASMELTDGWYSIRAAPDACLQRAIDNGKVHLGDKLAIINAVLEGPRDGMDVLDAQESAAAPVLRLFGNSTRRAKWNAKLGYRRKSAMPILLGAVDGDGGVVSCIRVRVARIYPVVYLETVASTRAKDMKRDVTRLIKLRVIGSDKLEQPIEAVLTIWRPEDALLEAFREGQECVVYNVQATGKRAEFRRHQPILHLQSTPRTRWRMIGGGGGGGQDAKDTLLQHGSAAADVPRHLITADELGQSDVPPPENELSLSGPPQAGSEADMVLFVVDIKRSFETHQRRGESTVRLTEVFAADSHGSLCLIKCQETGSRTAIYLNLFKKGKVFVALNLVVDGKDRDSGVPVLMANEETDFWSRPAFADLALKDLQSRLSSSSLLSDTADQLRRALQEFDADGGHDGRGTYHNANGPRNTGQLYNPAPYHFLVNELHYYDSVDRGAKPTQHATSES
ncbi:hypothetical protein RI367_000345 [Sorochytrium milnesiophthora]